MFFVLKIDVCGCSCVCVHLYVYVCIATEKTQEQCKSGAMSIPSTIIEVSKYISIKRK